MPRLQPQWPRSHACAIPVHLNDTGTTTTTTNNNNDNNTKDDNTNTSINNDSNKV